MKKLSLAILIVTVCGFSATAQQNKGAAKNKAAVHQINSSSPVAQSASMNKPQLDAAKRTAEKQRIEATKINPAKPAEAALVDPRAVSPAKHN